MNEEISDCSCSKHRRGRPRKSEFDNSQKESLILSSALELFQKQGYQKTSMTQIAHRAGMQQSSLYYHFSSKEALLDRLYDFDRVKGYFEEIRDLEIDKVLKLYIYTVYDLVSKCDLPFDFFEFEAVASDDPDTLSSLLETYRTVYHCLLQTITEGMEEDVFSASDPHTHAINILSINEGLQHHYHAKGRGQLILETAGYSAKNLSPEEIGAISARLILSRLCAERPNFDILQAEASKVLAQITNSTDSK